MLGNQVWINYGNTGELKFEPLVGTVSEAFAHEKHFKSRRAGTIAECPLLGAVNHLRLKQPKMPRHFGRSERSKRRRTFQRIGDAYGI